MALDRDDLTLHRRGVSHEESLAAAAELQELVAQRARELNVTGSLVDELLTERRADASLD